MTDKGPEPQHDEHDAPAEQTPAAEAPKTFDEAYVKDLRSENASWRKKVREMEQQLSELTSARKQQEESELAEQQKWQQLAEKRAQELAALQAQLKAKDVEVARVKVATQIGLPMELADRLRGETEDELAEDARKLAALLPPQKPAESAPEDAEAPQTQQQPEQAPPAQEARRPQTTTAVPGGPPVGKTDVDRSREYFNPPVESPIFNRGQVRINTKSTTLD